jgi:putative SOS response-associated peptidase YedK
MCGRYANSQAPEFIARLFRTVNALPNVAPSWNIAPSQDAMVVRRHPETGERHLDLLPWGLVPHWSKDPPKTKHPINARAETVATSGMFRRAFAQRRCLVPADAFYEWKATEGGKQPFAIVRQDGQPMAFAGLWEGYRWPDGTVLRTFAIITTNANAELTGLHDRMPVILDRADWPAWLGEAEAIAPHFFARRLLGRYEPGRSAPGSTLLGTMTPSYSPRCSCMACLTHPAWFPGFPCWSAGGLHITTYLARSKCSTSRSAVICAINSSAPCTRSGH